MNKYLLGVFLFFEITFLGVAQKCDYQLSGRVIDFHDSTALVNSVIKIKNLNIQTIADIDGFYHIKGLCKGVYEIEISHLGCITLHKKIKLDKTKFINFKLEHHLEELNEVEIQVVSIHNKNNSTISESLGPEIIENYSGVSLGDAMKEIRGISSLNTGNTIVKPVVHGLHSSRVPIIHNKVRLHDQEWGVEHAPNLDINTAENITVIKGSSALRYGGDAIGGVILVNNKKAPIKDTIFGKTIVGFVSNGRGGNMTSNLLKSTKKGWYFRGQGTFKYFGDSETTKEVLSNTGFRENNFSLSFGLNTFIYGFDAYYSFFHTKIGILRASHIGTTSDLIAAINSPNPLIEQPFTYDINNPKQDINHQMLKLNFFKRFEKKGKWSLQYAYQWNRRKEFDIRRGSLKGIASLDIDLKSHIINSNFEYDTYSGFKLNSGIEILHQINFPNPETNVRRLIPDYTMNTIGIYALSNFKLNNKTYFDMGIRYDFSRIDAKKFYLKSRWISKNYDKDFSDLILEDHLSQWLVRPVFKQDALSGALGMSYIASKNLSVKINFSTSSRMPNPSEYFSDGLHHSTAAIELGDLRLKKETSFKSAISLEAKTKKWNFNIEPHINKIYDFIVLEPTNIEYTLRGSFLVWEYKKVDAFLAGIDIYLKYKFSDYFDVDSNFSYLYGQDLTKNRPLIHIPAPNIKTNLNCKYKNSKISLGSETVFEQKRFPDNDFSHTYQNPISNEIEEVSVSISKPPSWYHLLNLSIETSLKNTVKSNLKLGFIITNLLNVEYSDYLNRQRYYANNQGRNIKLQIKYNY